VTLLVAVLDTPASEQAMAAFDHTWAAIGTVAVAHRHLPA
jgi:hypothetical protein